MSRNSLQTSWEVLEGSGPLQKRLAALAEIEFLVAPEDEGALLRLRTLSRRTAGPLADAIEHVLLRFRRSQGNWDVLTQNPATRREGQISSVLRQAGEILGRADPAQRTEFVDRCAENERFEVGPVLATKILTERDPEVAAAMARALGKLGTDACLPSLKQASRHPSAEVRLGSVQGLVYQRGAEPLRLLVERLGDGAKEVAWAAFDALETLPLGEVLALLEQLPPGRVVEVQVGAVEFLKGFLDDLQVLELLRRWLRSADGRLAAECLVALASVRDRAAEERIAELAADPDPRSQQVVSLARAAYEGREAPRRR